MLATLILCSLVVLQSQHGSDRYVLAIDRTKPYVYVEFERLYDKASDPKQPKVIGATLVNNSRIPISVQTAIQLGDKHIRVPYSIRRNFWMTTDKPTPNGFALDSSGKRILKPGQRLLISFPIESLSPDFGVLVPFEFESEQVGAGQLPHTAAPFNWEDLPAAVRSQLDAP